MFRGRIVVAGAGVAGPASALLLARDGHQVTLLERDPPGPELPASKRRGVPHYLQPHALIPRARLELRELLPDVYADLLARGAWDIDVRPKLPGGAPALDEDELLQWVAARRPLVETVLRAAVLAEPRITWQTEHRVTTVPEADLVVDALGRRSLFKQETETSDCGVVYYCRYYQQHPGFELPDGPWLLSPRADLGYFGFASFAGDNRTFGLVLAVPPGDPDWKLLRQPAAYEAAVAAIPDLATWADPSGCDPITDVLAMAGLRNAAPPASLPPGRVVVGDALGHTDPVLAHGLAFSLIHARALREAVRAYDDVGDLAAAYLADVRPLLQERYELLTALDAQRLNRWRGGAVDLARDRALWSIVAPTAVATVDPTVFRVHVRRIGLLDSSRVLDDDAALRSSIEEQLPMVPTRSYGPSREEMVALLRSHAQAGSQPSTSSAVRDAGPE